MNLRMSLPNGTPTIQGLIEVATNNPIIVAAAEICNLELLPQKSGIAKIKW